APHEGPGTRRHPHRRRCLRGRAPSVPAGPAVRADALLPRPLAALLPAAALRGRRPRPGAGPLVEPVRARRRAAGAAGGGLSAGPAPGAVAGRAALLADARTAPRPGRRRRLRSLP